VATNQGKGKKQDDDDHTDQRGFASMEKEKQREIASKGGKAAHKKGSAHEFDSDEAQEAGRKGGESISEDKEHMSEIGRKGGKSSHGGGRPAGSEGDKK
jgi:uncharacterized protein